MAGACDVFGGEQTLHGDGGSVRSFLADASRSRSGRGCNEQSGMNFLQPAKTSRQH